MRLKMLISSLRKRKRYILFKVFSEESINYTSFKELLNSTFLKFYGELEFSKFDFKLLDERWDDKEHIGIAKCNHKFTPNVIVIFGLLQRIGEYRINVKILKVSGTIKSLLKNLRMKFKVNNR